MCIICIDNYKIKIKKLACGFFSKPRSLMIKIPFFNELYQLQCYNCPLLTKIPVIQGLHNLECYNCPLLTKIPVIHGLHKLECYNCQLLTKIPFIIGLQLLQCYYCPLLKKIPLIVGLQSIHCSYCPLLECFSVSKQKKSKIDGVTLWVSFEIIKIKGLQYIFLDHCASLTNIPLIEGLKILHCYNCRSLTNITLINGLQELHCGNCPMLSNIPLIKGLQQLSCDNCPLVKNIPLIEELQRLKCTNCPLLTNVPTPINNIPLLYCYNCKWLKENNYEYDNNIKKIKIIQRFIKKNILGKRLIRLIPKIIPIYYHPEYKGGYMHKKQMLIDVQWR